MNENFVNAADYLTFLKYSFDAFHAIIEGRIKLRGL